MRFESENDKLLDKMWQSDHKAEFCAKCKKIIMVMGDTVYLNGKSWHGSCLPDYKNRTLQAENRKKQNKKI